MSDIRSNGSTHWKAISASACVWLLYFVVLVVDWLDRAEFVVEKVNTMTPILAPVVDFLLSGWGQVCLIVFGFICLYLARSLNVMASIDRMRACLADLRHPRFRSPITFSCPSKYVKAFLAPAEIVGLESKQGIEFLLNVFNGLDTDIVIKRHFIGEMVYENTGNTLSDTAVNLIMNDDGVVSSGGSKPIIIKQPLGEEDATKILESYKSGDRQYFTWEKLRTEFTYRNKEYSLPIPKGATFMQGTQIGEKSILELNNTTHTTVVR